MTANPNTLLKPWSGTWIPTHSGKVVELLHPTPEMIDIEDIAHALAHIPRYTGHASHDGVPYSVAQHSCLVHDIVRQEVKLAALLHDAHEAYISDMSSPLKNALMQLQPSFRLAWTALTARFDTVIAQRFGIREGCNFSEDKQIQWADKVLLHTEAHSFPNLRVELWGEKKLPDPLPNRIIPWSAKDAKEQFLLRFAVLCPDHLP